MSNKTTPKPPKRISRREVARLAGVSTTTITHVLQGNPKTGVSAETKERILRIVRETNYTPHAIASALDQRSTRHLAMVLGIPENVETMVFSPLLAACRQATQERGCYLMTYEVGERNMPDAGIPMSQLVQSGRADGLLIYKPDFLNKDIIFLQEKAIPFVAMESIFPVELSDVVSVTSDHALGGRIAASHVLSLGHRKITVFTRKFESIQLGYRRYPDGAYLEGIQETVAQWGLSPDQLTVIEGDTHDREKAMRALNSLRKNSYPTAILVADDLMASLALGFFQSKGLRVPEDISIVGYGNSPIASFTEPSLTTIQTPIKEVGEIAVKLLLDQINQKPIKQMRQKLTPQLIVRKSTGLAKPAND